MVCSLGVLARCAKALAAARGLSARGFSLPNLGIFCHPRREIGWLFPLFLRCIADGQSRHRCVGPTGERSLLCPQASGGKAKDYLPCGKGAPSGRPARRSAGAASGLLRPRCPGRWRKNARSPCAFSVFRLGAWASRGSSRWGPPHFPLVANAGGALGGWRDLPARRLGITAKNASSRRRSHSRGDGAGKVR